MMSITAAIKALDVLSGVEVKTDPLPTEFPDGSPFTSVSDVAVLLGISTKQAAWRLMDQEELSAAMRQDVQATLQGGTVQSDGITLGLTVSAPTWGKNGDLPPRSTDDYVIPLAMYDGPQVSGLKYVARRIARDHAPFEVEPQESKSSHGGIVEIHNTTVDEIREALPARYSGMQTKTAQTDIAHVDLGSDELDTPSEHGTVNGVIIIHKKSYLWYPLVDGLNPVSYEEKGIIRRVRSAGGAARFGQPIGSIITTDVPTPSKPKKRSATAPKDSDTPDVMMATPRKTPVRKAPAKKAPAKRLQVATSEYPGWNKWMLGKEAYYIGKEEGSTKWVAVDKDDYILAEDTNPAALKSKLEKLLDVYQEWTPTATTKHLEPTNDKKAIAAWAKKWGMTAPPSSDDWHITMDDNASLIALYRAPAGWKRVYSNDHINRQAIAKFQRVEEIGKVIGKLDKVLNKADLATDDIAAVTHLMRKSGIRAGDEGPQKGKHKVYGANTLLIQHATVLKGGVRLKFPGKDNVIHEHMYTDKQTMDLFKARVTRPEGLSDSEWAKKKAQPMFPGSDLDKTRDYIRKALGRDDAKNHDLRTLVASSMAQKLAMAYETTPPDTKAKYNAMVKEISTKVSEQLGNTWTQARDGYITPKVFLPFKQEGW